MLVNGQKMASKWSKMVIFEFLVIINCHLIICHPVDLLKFKIVIYVVFQRVLYLTLVFIDRSLIREGLILMDRALKLRLRGGVCLLKIIEEPKFSRWVLILTFLRGRGGLSEK